VFNTFEGGAIVSSDAITKQRIDYLKNFGFANEVTVVGPGINGKMNEFQAALGLLQLKYIDIVIEKRAQIEKLYRQALTDISGLSFLDRPPDVKPNFSYFPIFLDNDFGRSRDEVYEILKHKGIFVRRYFYPLISEFPTYRGLFSSKKENLPVSYKKARSVICLPIYPDLEASVVMRICEILKQLRKPVPLKTKPSLRVLC
jgi:dTDP-4-amino-4,6-dideoxygalactose transaminase